jgi:lactate dehydrogenase-like 2-hydroxyacid dehydrogenase
MLGKGNLILLNMTKESFKDAEDLTDALEKGYISLSKAYDMIEKILSETGV